jgi:hypothetical protein
MDLKELNRVQLVELLMSKDVPEDICEPLLGKSENRIL